MIILTQAQANQVRGLTVLGHALAPRPISIAAAISLAGKYALPEACITDPYHAPFAALLATFPIVLDNAVILYETDPIILANCAYSPTWQPGQLVPVNAIG